MELEKIHTSVAYLTFLLIKHQNPCFHLTKQGFFGKLKRTVNRSLFNNSFNFSPWTIPFLHYLQNPSRGNFHPPESYIHASCYF